MQVQSTTVAAPAQAAVAQPTKFFRVVGSAWKQFVGVNKDKEFISVRIGVNSQRNQVAGLTLNAGDTLFLRPNPFPKRDGRKDPDYQVCVSE